MPTPMRRTARARAFWESEEGESDGEFAVGDEEGDGRGVGENKIAEGGDHEGIGAAFGEKFVDPELKAAVQGELRVEDFVLGEDEEEEADADAEKREGAGVAGVGGEGHGGMIVKARCGEKKKRAGVVSDSSGRLRITESRSDDAEMGYARLGNETNAESFKIRRGGSGHDR